MRDGEAFTFLLALIIIVETTKGTFAFETYDSEAPKTVAHVVDLVRDGFYDGQRIHRAAPRFVVQWGDPRSRDQNNPDVRAGVTVFARSGKRAANGAGYSPSIGSPSCSLIMTAFATDFAEK